MIKIDIKEFFSHCYYFIKVFFLPWLNSDFSDTIQQIPIKLDKPIRFSPYPQYNKYIMVILKNSQIICERLLYLMRQVVKILQNNKFIKIIGL